MSRELIATAFTSLGFAIVHFPERKENNGPDLWVKKANGRPLSVEIKKARIQLNGCVQVDPVSKERRSDDLVAIICTSQYVLIEAMKDHLASCSNKGTRQMTLLLGNNP